MLFCFQVIPRNCIFVLSFKSRYWTTKLFYGTSDKNQQIWLVHCSSNVPRTLSRIISHEVPLFCCERSCFYNFLFFFLKFSFLSVLFNIRREPHPNKNRALELRDVFRVRDPGFFSVNISQSCNKSLINLVVLWTVLRKYPPSVIFNLHFTSLRLVCTVTTSLG